MDVISIKAAVAKDNAAKITGSSNTHAKPKKIRNVFERAAEAIFFISASTAILSVAAISVYIFTQGAPAIFEIGIKDFLFVTTWMPSAEEFGIFPMIVASVCGTVGATVIGTVIGLFTAIFLAEIAPRWLASIVRPAVELLAGIPSVVYGFFGLVVIIPLIDRHLGGGGDSLLAVIIILAIMILPTIISISETSIRAVPLAYREGSLALGATHVQTIFKVVLPAARSGIMASIVLGVGRAIGETMAVILISGNTVQIPNALTDRVRTLTANIALEMPYASGLHSKALFATGVVLFVFIMTLNLILNVFINRKVGE